MSERDTHYAGLAEDPPRQRARPGQAGMRRTVGDAAETVRDGYDRAADWAGDNLRSASRTLSHAQRRSARGLHDARGTIETFVSENPVMVGVVGLAAGLLVGSLLPSTRRENSAFGRYADEVKDQGRRYARDIAEQGKAYVEDSLETAKARVAEASEARSA